MRTEFKKLLKTNRRVDQVKLDELDKVLNELRAQPTKSANENSPRRKSSKKEDVPVDRRVVNIGLSDHS